MDCAQAVTFGSTYVAKVFIQQLDISVQHFEAQQLIIPVLHTGTEIQAGIPAREEDQDQMLQQCLPQCCEETLQAHLAAL